MHLRHYSYRTNNSFLDYEFTSVGPKGRIKKVVRFTQISPVVYNLAFGDLNEITGEINDIVITNNNDSRKVLATVAATVNDFTIHYPGVYVFAMGSTLSRTRLYRMGITNYWHDISKDFDVFGLNDGEWGPFQMRRDYEAFLVHRK